MRIGLRYIAVVVVALVSGCATTVKNYGDGDFFSRSEASTGSTSTREQCFITRNAVWVEGTSFHECIRYFPSQAFDNAPVQKAIVFMEGDVLSKSGPSVDYGTWSAKRELQASQGEEMRGGTPYLTLARPGVDGSSGNQNRRRTQYETLVMNAALDEIKIKYGIKTLGLVGQSGGGGLVAALIAERSDIVCAVSSSGVTSVKFRARAAGRSADVTGTSFSEVWDPIDQLPRVHSMPGFRMFVTSDATDSDVIFSSQDNYVKAAQKMGLPIYQIMVHGTGRRHHQTYRIGNRIVEDCMLGLPTEEILRTYSDMSNRYPHMNVIAREQRRSALGEQPSVGGPQEDDADKNLGR